MHDDTWAVLSWSPGRYALSHDVYFGDNYKDVNDGTEDTFRGNILRTYDPVGFGTYADMSGLEPGTTYYWRVDEVNDLHSDSPWKGDIWSFTIRPYTAFNPNPSNGAELTDPKVKLSWMAGFGAKLHTLYFGENSVEVEAGTDGTFKGSFSQTSYLLDCLDFGKTYYWRIDEFDGRTTHKGEIWSFITMPAAPKSV
jgi:hypothetical protein